MGRAPPQFGINSYFIFMILNKNRPDIITLGNGTSFPSCQARRGDGKGGIVCVYNMYYKANFPPTSKLFENDDAVT
jgi:hypothetical protein